MFVPGLDGSFTGGEVVPVEWFQRRYAEGYRVWAQCVWTGGYAGNDGIKRVASGNLLNAEAGGLKIIAYANASPPTWWPLDRQMQEIKTNCGAAWEHLQLLVVDVEIPGITYARVAELADALQAAGKNQNEAIEVLYTARWFWTGHMGNSKAIAWRRFRLWSAHYDWNPDIDFGDNLYGPWTIVELVGEQYRGTTRLDGVDVDLNVFDVARLFPAGPDGPPAPQPEEVTTMSSKEYTDALARIAALDAKLTTHLQTSAPVPAPTPTPKPAAPGTYTVVPGDNASSIAERFGLSLAQLKALNPGQPRSGDWGVIHKGEVFKIAGAPAPAPKPAPAPRKTHIVKSGDTLGAIAQQYTGDADRWDEIPNLPAAVRADPRKLQAGFVLVIPW